MKILIIRYSGLGDVVMLLQTINKLKKKYLNSKITLLTDHTNSSLKYVSCNLIDEIIPINRKVFKNKEVLNSLKEIAFVFKSIRQKFDMCIDFQNFGETATISYLVNAKIKIGAPKSDKYNYGYTEIIERDERGHRSQFFSRIAKVDDQLAYSKLCLNEESLNYKELIYKKLDQNKKTIGFNIGSTQDSRRWDENKFAEVQNILQEEYNILIFIGPSEKKFKYAFDTSSFFIEDVNLIKLCGAISLCNLFLTNDTGPAHLAAALNIPTITLFSTGTDENVGSLIEKKAFLSNSNINDISITNVIEKINLFV